MNWHHSVDRDSAGAGQRPAQQFDHPPAAGGNPWRIDRTRAGDGSTAPPACAPTCSSASAQPCSRCSLEGLAGVPSDAARIAAQIIPGIGFIGAGSIIHTRGLTTGLTTAATIFVVASVGMAAGGGLYLTAIFATGLVLAALFLLGHYGRELQFQASDFQLRSHRAQRRRDQQRSQSHS